MTISEALIKKLNSQKEVDRNAIQDVVVQVCRDYKNVYLNLATRLGKNRAIMRVVEDLKLTKVLYVAGQNIHLTTFTENCAEFNHDTSPYTLICWNSYKKYQDEHWQLIIQDEADLAWESHIRYYDMCTYDRVILLTATMDKEIEKAYKDKLNFFKFSVDLNKAIAWKILPMPKVYVKRIVPDKKYQKKLEDLDKLIKSYYEKGNTFMCKRKGLDRKKLYEEIKMKWFEDDNLFERLKNKRTIFFLPDIKKSQLLGNAVSSLESKKENKQILDDYNNKITNYIISNKILIRGVSLYDVKFALILTLDLKGGTTVQKTGRVLLDNESSIIFVYVANTREETVVLDFIKKLNAEIIWMK